MAAGLGFKTFTSGEVLTAADTNGYLMQGINVFANASARSAAITSPQEGQYSFLKDTNALEYYDGAAWVGAPVGDITAVTAGKGLTGGGSSGDVTVSLATTAKGDLVAGSGASTAAVLTVGNNGETLVADSSTSTGLRYTAGTVQGNPVLNSAFQIWQRGTSFSLAASTAGTYTADRWQTSTGTNQAITVSRQATNDTTNLPSIQYCLRYQRNSGQTGTSGLYTFNVFESVNSIPFAGKTVTYSFYARAGANYSASSSQLSTFINTGTGTDQAAFSFTNPVSVGSVALTLTTTWQRFTATGTIPTNATQMSFVSVFTPTGTAGANDYYEITGVQIDIGSVALPFRTYAGTIQGELAACQRYFYRAVNGADNTEEFFSVGQAYSTTATVQILRNPVTMRTNPTLTVSSGSHFQVLTSIYGTVGTTGVAPDKYSPRQTSILMTGASGLTAGNASGARANSASATLDLSAEL